MSMQGGIQWLLGQNEVGRCPKKPILVHVQGKICPPLGRWMVKRGQDTIVVSYDERCHVFLPLLMDGIK